MFRSTLGRGLVGVGFVLLFPALTRADEDVPLRNWTSPPYWQGAKAKGQDAADSIRSGPGRREPLALPSAALPFIAITPCRVADTRDATFPPGFGIPMLNGGGAARPFVIPSGPCPGLPGNAGAWSLNFTVVAPPGTPAGGYLSVWPTGSPQPIVSTLNFTSNSILANAAVVPAGAGGSINAYVNFSTDLIIDINGYYAGTGAVTSLNALSGDVTLLPGSSISISPAGQSLTISGPTALPPVGAAGGSLAGSFPNPTLAANSVGMAQIDSSQVQARVTSACPAGSTIQSINADGSVVCSVNPVLSAGFSLTPLDTTGSVGFYTSITIGADGLGLISYYDSTNNDLKVAHCTDATCTAATLSTLDSTGDVGQDTSITIGSDGLGLISYYDNTNFDLKVAHCSNVNCTAATVTALDTTGIVGHFSSITIGSDGLGLISYYDGTNADLKVAHCSDVNCTAATLTTLDGSAQVGEFTSITIGSDGLGLISYLDMTSSDLKVAHCSNSTCTAATLSTVDSAGNVGQYTSITIGSDGLGLISYRDFTNGVLKVAHCSNVACSSATFAPFDTAVDGGWQTSITVGSDGLGLICYREITNIDLKVAHCSNVACTGATFSTVDGVGSVGAGAITIGSDGFALISYTGSGSDLKVAHCSNALCTPFARRR